MGWRLPPRGKSASPSLFYPFEKTSERGRNFIGREMGRIRQCGAYGNAARCIGQEYAASAIARRCVFGDRLMPAGAPFLSIPALQRSKGVAGRANGHVHLSPKRKLEPCTRTFLTSYLPEALHHPTFPTLCKQQRKGNGQEAGAALPAKRSAPHSPVLHSV